MKKLLIAALLFAPLPALAEDITVSVGNVSQVWTLTPTDQQKFEAWVQSAYKCLPSKPQTTTTPDCPPLTLQESEVMWAKATLQGTADNVTRFQNALAAAAGVQATTPLNFSVDAKSKTK